MRFVADEIRKLIGQAIKKLDFGEAEFTVEHPAEERHGDYATNVAMVLAKKTGENPRKLAEKVAGKIGKSEVIEKIEVAGPGFINFYVSEQFLLEELGRVLQEGDRFGASDWGRGKKFLIEHTSPNTIKTLHVGHIRNNVLGMAMKRILEFGGVEVKLDSINNDRGIHVMKAVWAYMKYGKNKTPESEKMKADVFVNQYYVLGVKAAKDKRVKEEMQELLRQWEAGDKKVRAVWKKLRDWTFEGFVETYERLGSEHDKQWFESDFYEKGREVVLKRLREGVFRKLSDGAILSDLGKYGLPDTIVLRADGTTMYHTQDLYLTQLKRKEFPSDLYIWDIGSEQALYLQQLFAMCDQLGIGKKEDYFHMIYGFIFLKGRGKMSSRKGNVVAADWLMDEMVKRAGEFNQAVAEVVGVGAIKYGLLKLSRTSNIQFDINESLALQGNSGPYLQYTHARACSVLAKAKLKMQSSKFELKIQTFNTEEMAILRWLYRFPEVVRQAGERYEPSLICTYLYELAQRFNTFYNKHSVLKPQVTNNKEQVRDFRLRLTAAVGQVVKNGLWLLGIKAPRKM